MAVVVSNKTKKQGLKLVSTNDSTTADAFVLRWYQERLHNAAKAWWTTDTQRGQFYAPTGAGKTVNFNEFISYVIEMLKAEGKSANICVVHPRIALSTDQLKRYKKSAKGHSVMTTSFHSGKHYIGKGETLAERSTTSTTDLAKLINVGKSNFDAHITFSSYQSFDRLFNAGITSTFDLVIFDEAHYIASDNRYRLWNEMLDTPKVLYYTATPMTTEFNGAMDNVAQFGEVLDFVEPRELIADGFVVAPFVNTIHAVTDKRKNVVDVVDLIARAYVAQHAKMSFMPFHQMLVAARGAGEGKDIDVINKAAFKGELASKIAKYSKGKVKNIDIYTVTGGEHHKNGVKLDTDRDAMLDEIKFSNDNAIVVHFDTLAEGIDISSLGGFLPLRKLRMDKLMQSIGRCARPFAGLYDSNNEIIDGTGDFNADGSVKPLAERQKPLCVVTLPVIDGKLLNGDDEAAKVVRAFRAAGYGELKTSISIEDKGNTPQEEKGPKPGVDAELGSLIERVVSDELEAEANAIIDAVNANRIERLRKLAGK